MHLPAAKLERRRTALLDLLTPQGESVILSSMGVRILTAVLTVLVQLLVPFTLAGQTTESLVGTWELDTASSTQSSNRFKRTTCRIERWEDGLRVSYELVGIRGGVIHLEWTGRFDGQDYSVQGADYVLTNAYTWIDSETYDVVVKLDGRLVASARTTLSRDGQTLTTVSKERNAGGQEIQSTVIYQRQ